MLAPRSRAAALATALLCLAAPASAAGHDSLAPAGAEHAWLPALDDWVMQHWVPFDETRLYTALGIDNLALERWMRDDHRTIAQLAERRRGLAVGELADYLIEPWRANTAPQQLAVLHERTMRMLTQGHLAQHVLFHYFHGTYALANTRLIFGVDRKTFKRLRQAGWTPLAIGRTGGRSPARIDREMRRILRYSAGIGVDNESHTPAQAAYMLKRRIALLPCFLRRPVAKLDPGNPYGDPNNGHGEHERSSRVGLLPTTKQRRARKKTRSCWHEPSLPASRAAATRPAAGTPIDGFCRISRT